jgi:NAD(P)-dependent dehydrogenase (short-subunit alcohol dehydrogenase family)
MAVGGRVAWITGGSSGIGLAAAQALAQAGYRVVLSARGREGLDAAVRALGPAAEAEPMDAALRPQVDAAAQAILSRHGRIDVLVNSAGFNVAARQWGELTAEDFDAVLAGNLSGTFYAVHAALPAMRAQGDGVIVNVASMAARTVTPYGGVAYTVAKQGVITLTATLNQAEFRHGIRACALIPGEVATPIMQKRVPPPPPEVLDRMLQAEDVARAIRFIVETPAHACIPELVMAPTWNRALA